MDAPAPPSVPPPATQGLAAWTDGPRGLVRLPWLPDTLSVMPGYMAIVLGGAAVAGLACLFAASGWYRMVAISVFATAAGLAWADRYMRAWARARTFIAIDPARGVLRVAQVAQGLDMVLPVGSLGAVAVRGLEGGAHVMLRRHDAPDLMVSDALDAAAAQAAAAALAQRLGIPCETSPVASAPQSAPVPPPPMVAADAPPDMPYPPHAERIPLHKNPAAVGREALWLAGFVAACGLASMLISEGLPVMRLLGVILMILGLAMTQLYNRREAWAREQVVVVDRAAGTVALRGLTSGAGWLKPPGPPMVLPLAAVRRVVATTAGENPAVAIDFFDRPRFVLPAGGGSADMDALAARLALAIGSPMETTG